MGKPIASGVTSGYTVTEEVIGFDLMPWQNRVAADEDGSVEMCDTLRVIEYP